MKKPTDMNPGEWWATVAEVHEADGNGPGERTWSCEMLGYGCLESAALDAATTWWEETDQSQRCEVSIRLEDHAGVAKVVRMAVGPEVRARVVADNRRSA